MKFNNKNVIISPTASIGKNVRIGDNTVIYDNVVIHDNTVICNDCVIGEPLHDYYFNSKYENPKTVIGANSIIRSHTIIYSGNTIGDFFSTGHRVTIREKMNIGDHCSIGTLSDLQGYSTIGRYCRFHSNVHIGQKSTIGDFVFIYPYVVFTNDPHPPSNICEGPTIGDYTQIAVHSVVLPGVVIGKNCLVGANSTVSKNFGDELIIVGSPAKDLGPINKIKSRINPNESYYPWMKNFDRGMPWDGVGYEEWAKTQG